MKISILSGLLSTFLILTIHQAIAQTENTKDTVRLVDMSFADLMNVKIISVSKKAENLFDAPLSASVLNRKKYKKPDAPLLWMLSA